MSRALRFLVGVVLLLGGGCSSLAPLLSTPTPVPVSHPVSTPQSVATQTALPATEARILRVWLPPQFDPNGETESANLLKQRLIGFESQHPGLEIEVRIKAEDGEAGLLNSLSITSIAAHTALPDLIALPRPALEAAALKGLLHPIDGLSTALQDPDWYGYARQMGHIQNIGYGLPFAGDALALVYQPDIDALNNWNDIFVAKKTLVFPASDPQGLVGLCLYVSAGGEILDTTGLPTLDQNELIRVLTWVENGVSSGVLSPSLTNVITDAQALETFRSGDADIAITWAFNIPVESSLVPLPGLSDSNYSFATGWVWALAGSNAENQQMAIELAEYLVADDFIGDWTQDAGYLPTRPSGAVDRDSATVAIVESAQAIPSNDVLLVLGPLMQEALTRVLNGEQPEVVAGSVIEKLK